MNHSISPKINEIQQNVHLIEFDDSKKLYLVGTAHVSAESVKLVEDTINQVSPDTVCVELDDQRYQSMINKKKYKDLDFIEIIRKKQLFFFIGQFIMASYQKKISEKTGSKPGEEFKRAIDIADEKKARLVLADRNIGVTLKRAWRLTPFKHKLMFLGSGLFGDDEELEDVDIESLKSMDAIDNMIKSFSDELPITKEVLIDERDFYLANEIKNNLGEVTVAVVGAGHVPGMLNHFKGEMDPSRKEEIDFVPPPSVVGKTVPWLIPAVVVGVITWGFMSGRKEVAADAVYYWIMANGILTAIGCLLAFAHPLTIISGFIAAPLTSLNPTIGAGFVTALVQTFLVKPRVLDFEQIQNKTLRFRNWWSNRITRIFLVFILSSIGSTIGTFVALPFLTQLFK